MRIGVGVGGGGLCVASLAWVACTAAQPPTAAPVVGNTAAATPEVAHLMVHYATYGLMPAPVCGSPTYRIDITEDDAVACGWTSTCPPYSVERPLVAAPHGTIAPERRARLLAEAHRPEFATMKSQMNAHIIDGGERDLTVQGRRVEMVNITDPAFERFLDALARETGCPASPTTAPPR
jgi:hypothetical protein